MKGELNMTDHVSLCADCGKAGKLRCSSCREIHYCSKDCQRLHWPKHKLACKKLSNKKRRIEVERGQALLITIAKVASAGLDPLQAMLDTGVPASSVDDYGQTGLYLACSLFRSKHMSEEHCLSIANILIPRGCPVNAQTSGDGNKTALMQCTASGSIQLCELLVNYGADLFSTDSDGFTCFHSAFIDTSGEGNFKSSTSAMINKLLSFLQSQCQLPHQRKELLNKRTDVGFFAVLYAAVNNDAESLKSLLKAGASPYPPLNSNICIGNGLLPLSHCLRIGSDNACVAELRDYFRSTALVAGIEDADTVVDSNVGAEEQLHSQRMWQAEEKAIAWQTFHKQLAGKWNEFKAKVSSESQGKGRDKVIAAEQCLVAVNFIMAKCGMSFDVAHCLAACASDPSLNPLLVIAEWLGSNYPLHLSKLYYEPFEFNALADDDKLWLHYFHFECCGDGADVATPSDLMMKVDDGRFISSAYRDMHRGVFEPLTLAFSFSVPSQQALEAIARHAPILELGCGSGYWAALLRARGVDILAYDHKPPTAEHENEFYNHTFIDVTRGHGPVVAGSAMAQGRTLFLSWPLSKAESAQNAIDRLQRLKEGREPEQAQEDETEPWDCASLRRYEGDYVCYVGELQCRNPGNAPSITASMEFEEYLLEHFSLETMVACPRFVPTAADELTIWRRK